MSFSYDFTIEGAQEFLDSLDSPEYHPTSPKVPDTIEINANTIWIPDDPVENQEIEELSVPKEKSPEKFVKRKRKTNKQKAELQFDLAAEPVNLQKFCQFIIAEPADIEIDVLSNKELDVIEDLKIEDKLVAEECAILNLVVAANNCPDDKIDKDLIVKVEFPDEITKVYCDNIGVDFDEIDFSDEVIGLPSVKVNQQLFYQRRLINSLILRLKSDSEFINSHFPFDEQLTEFKIHSLYNDDENSWNVIRARLQDICLETTSLNSLFYGKNWKNNVREMLSWRKCTNMQIVAICTLLTCFSRHKVDRSQRLVDIDPELFGKSKFKFFNLTEMFRKIGIVFFTDYCHFSFFEDRIMNLFMYSHKDVLTKIKNERKRNKKVKIDDQRALLDAVASQFNF